MGDPGSISLPESWWISEVVPALRAAHHAERQGVDSKAIVLDADE